VLRVEAAIVRIEAPLIETREPLFDQVGSCVEAAG
jgi:hypothetical protein